MNNKPLIPTPFDDEVELTRHIADKYRCLCPDCVEKRRVDRIRQDRLNKEWEDHNRRKNEPTL